MGGRGISDAEVEEAWALRQITALELRGEGRSGDILIIRSTLASGRRLKVVVSADEERFVITVADQDEEGR